MNFARRPLSPSICAFFLSRPSGLMKALQVAITASLPVAANCSTGQEDVFKSTCSRGADSENLCSWICTALRLKQEKTSRHRCGSRYGHGRWQFGLRRRWVLNGLNGPRQHQAFVHRMHSLSLSLSISADPLWTRSYLSPRHCAACPFPALAFFVGTLFSGTARFLLAPFPPQPPYPPYPPQPPCLAAQPKTTELTTEFVVLEGGQAGGTTRFVFPTP